MTRNNEQERLYAGRIGFNERDLYLRMQDYFLGEASTIPQGLLELLL